MSKFPPEDKKKLLEFIGREIELFGKIRELTAEQKEFLAADDMEGLNLSLDKRQQIIEKINGLHQESDVLMQSYISFSNSRGGEKIAEIESGQARIRAVLEECAELDGENALMANKRVLDYGRQIDELSTRRKGIGKYALDVPNNPEHFDKMT